MSEKIFFRDSTVSRPVYPKILKDYSDLKRSLNYTIPAYFEKRCRYLVKKRHHTNHYPLDDKHLRELYLFLSSNTPEDLMIVHDVYNKKGVVNGLNYIPFYTVILIGYRYQLFE